MGFILGIVLFCLAVATNRTLSGKRHYLYPLIPFDWGAMKRLVLRLKKSDVGDSGESVGSAAAERDGK